MFIGVVKSKKDIIGKGVLTVCPAELDCKDPNNEISVKYTSFYMGGAFAGAVFVPEKGDTILYDVAKNDPQVNYFYMSTVMDPDIDKKQDQVLVPSDKNRALGAPVTYSHDSEDGAYNDQSMSYGISTPLGHHLLMMEGRDAIEDNKGVRLSSARGHSLGLDDSSLTQHLNLHSYSEGASLKMTDLNSEDKPIGPEGSQLHSIHNVVVATSEGELIIRNQDGRNIQIQNKATGSKSGTVFKRSECGNIEISADRGDISIINHGNGIFIDCLGATQSDGATGASFQVRSNNKIQLYSMNGIDLKSAGDINIKGQNVNIEAENRINLNDPNSIDGDFGIRKRNDEIDIESNQGDLPFFDNPAFYPINYTQGSNTDPRL